LNDPNCQPFLRSTWERCSKARAEINNIEGFGAVVAETIADFFAGK